MNSSLHGEIEQIWKIGINDESKDTYPSVCDYGRQSTGNFGSRGREESHQSCRKEFVEFFIFSQEISENRDEEKTKWNKWHEKKIGYGSGMKRAIVFEKSDKTLQKQFHFVSACGVICPLHSIETQESWNETQQRCELFFSSLSFESSSFWLWDYHHSCWSSTFYR